MRRSFSQADGIIIIAACVPVMFLLTKLLQRLLADRR